MKSIAKSIAKVSPILFLESIGIGIADTFFWEVSVSVSPILLNEYR
jgi:hypothetical protein